MSVRRALQDLIILLLVCTTQAALVNRSIDDTYGDLSTGQKPVYQPSDIWFGPSCNETRCFVQPTTSLAFNHTWTAAVYGSSTKNMNITFSFTGVSVWIFFILSNNGNVGGIVSVPTSTECNFTIDGNHMGAFSYQPNNSEAAQNIQYNATVFSASGLSNSQHEFVISTSGAPNMTYVNFDYAIYSADVPDNVTSSTSTSSSSSSSGIVGGKGSTEAHHPSSNHTFGIVVGCVLGGLAIALVGALILFRRLQRKPKEPILTSFNQQPPQGYHDEVTDSNTHLPLQSFIYNESTSSGTLYDQRTRIFLPAGESVTSIPVRRENQSLYPYRTKNRDELRAVRQMEIDQRLQTAQQEMHNLTSRQSAIGGEPGSGLSLSSEARGQEMEHEMVIMRERIHQLRMRIEQLQMERSSDWAQGLSDDPPPAYYSLS